MKLRIVVSIALLCPAALVAQVSVPKVGMARYADHTVRGINGLESNLLVDSQGLSNADSISFSDTGGLVSAAGRIQLLTIQGVTVGEYTSNESSPVLNMDGGVTTAIGWLPSRSLLIYWNGSSFTEVPVNSAELPGEVTSVRAASATSATLLTSDAHGNVFQASVALPAGNITSVNQLPGVKGPAFQQSGYIVFLDSNGLEIEAPNAAARTLSLSAPDLKFERMSTEWVHLTSPTTHQDWALHLSSRALQLSILPAPSTAGASDSQMRHAQEVRK